MVVASAVKQMELREFEPVIRRCPVCIVDTEQRAFYAYKPDFTVRVESPTNPPFPIILEPRQAHPFNWYVVALCKKCNYLYSVFGIEQYRIKNLPQQSKQWNVRLATLCCDICYNEDYNYRIADIFINLSSGRPVYLCEAHSNEVESKKRPGNYEELNRRIDSWPRQRVTPKGMLIIGELIALDDDRQALLTAVYEEGASSADSLTGNSAAKARSLAYLLKKGLLLKRSEGLLLKRSRLTVTEKGKEVIENLQRMF